MHVVNCCEVLGGGGINPHRAERPEHRVKRIHDVLRVLKYKPRCEPSTAMFVNACFSRTGTELIHFNAIDRNIMPKGTCEGPVLDYLMARLLLLKQKLTLSRLCRMSDANVRYYGSHSGPHTGETAGRLILGGGSCT